MKLFILLLCAGFACCLPHTLKRRDVTGYGPLLKLLEEFRDSPQKSASGAVGNGPASSNGMSQFLSNLPHYDTALNQLTHGQVYEDFMAVIQRLLLSSPGLSQACRTYLQAELFLGVSIYSLEQEFDPMQAASLYNTVLNWTITHNEFAVDYDPDATLILLTPTQITSVVDAILRPGINILENFASNALGKVQNMQAFFGDFAQTVDDLYAANPDVTLGDAVDQLLLDAEQITIDDTTCNTNIEEALLEMSYSVAQSIDYILNTATLPVLASDDQLRWDLTWFIVTSKPPRVLETLDKFMMGEWDLPKLVKKATKELSALFFADIAVREEECLVAHNVVSTAMASYSQYLTQPIEDVPQNKRIEIVAQLTNRILRKFSKGCPNVVLAKVVIGMVYFHGNDTAGAGHEDTIESIAAQLGLQRPDMKTQKTRSERSVSRRSYWFRDASTTTDTSSTTDATVSTTEFTLTDLGEEDLSYYSLYDLDWAVRSIVADKIHASIESVLDDLDHETSDWVLWSMTGALYSQNSTSHFGTVMEAVFDSFLPHINVDDINDCDEQNGLLSRLRGRLNQAINQLGSTANTIDEQDVTTFFQNSWNYIPAGLNQNALVTILPVYRAEMGPTASMVGVLQAVADALSPQHELPEIRQQLANILALTLNGRIEDLMQDPYWNGSMSYVRHGSRRKG